MRVCFISTYPPIECGIATYTSYLSRRIKELNNEVYIISHTGGSGEKVFPVFDSSDPGLAEKAFDALIKFSPDIVHIQHEYGLFGKDRGVNVIPLLYKLKMAEIPTVVTLHTVYETFTPSQRLICDGIARTADTVIVHQKFQKAAIRKQISTNANVRVIPHGVRKIKTTADLKKRLGVEDRKIILIAGYFRPTKGYDRIIKIFPEILKKCPDACLLVAGKSRLQEYREYRDYFFRLIENSPVADNIITLRGQFPQETFDAIISAADVVPMPYLLGAQSGIMAHCFAFGKPVVASPLPAFLETLEDSCGGLIADSDRDFSESIIKLLKDSDLYREKVRNINDYVKKHLTWEKVAAETIKLYRKLVNVPYGKSQYIEI